MLHRLKLCLVSSSYFLSALGDYVFDIGIVIHLYKETGSALIISGFFLSQLLPMLLLFVVGNLTLDRFDKKKIFIVVNMLRCIIVLMLFFNQSIEIIYLVSFVLGFFDELSNTTHNALVPSLFDKTEIVKVNSSLSILDSLSMIASPIIASFLSTLLGLKGNILINAFTFLMVSIIYLFLKTENTKDSINETANGKRSIKDIKQGFADIIKNKSVIGIGVYWSLFMLCIGMTSTITIFVLTDVLNVSEKYYGIATAVEGAGILIASFYLLRKKCAPKPFTMIQIGIAFSALSYFIMGASFNLIIFLLACLFVGVSASFCPIGFKSYIQTNTSENQIGKTFVSLRFLVLIARMIGLSATGILLQSIGIRPVFVIAGVISLGILILTCLPYIKMKKS